MKTWKIFSVALLSAISTFSSASVYTLYFSGTLGQYTETGFNYGLAKGERITGTFTFNPKEATLNKDQESFIGFVNAQINEIDVFSIDPQTLPFKTVDTDQMVVSKDSSFASVVDVDVISFNDRQLTGKFGSCNASYCREVSLRSWDPASDTTYGLHLSQGFFPDNSIRSALEKLSTTDPVPFAISDFLPIVGFEYKDNGNILKGKVVLDSFGPVAPVPLPAAAWLFLTALGSLAFIRRRNKN